jgi:Tfp pilus assembly protein PilN
LFSEYLFSLSRTIVTGVWLTDIIIQKNGQTIILKGNSLNREVLQGFLKNLAQEKKFSGFNLNINNIEEAGKNESNLKFELIFSKK